MQIICKAAEERVQQRPLLDDPRPVTGALMERGQTPGQPDLRHLDRDEGDGPVVLDSNGADSETEASRRSRGLTDPSHRPPTTVQDYRWTHSVG
ncbi:hypothetical protein F2P81_012532 [Scophthalmus maximus]|uniref:Uncharacterized protein n=1 Tax=Scophthalmus maximus TaxID=52904 RepID=A0A6A4SUP2_SCOMX|nr:hypothetical protein F2P81_012532 [Scophthalmus maximus]